MVYSHVDMELFIVVEFVAAVVTCAAAIFWLIARMAVTRSLAKMGLETTIFHEEFFAITAMVLKQFLVGKMTSANVAGV